MPAGASNVTNVDIVVLGRRHDEEAAFAAIAVETPRKVYDPGTKHDGCVR